MSLIESVGEYRSVWAEGHRRVAGPDEDVITLAIAACTAALSGATAKIRRVVIVTEAPDITEGSAGYALRMALRLPRSVAVEFRQGGGPASLDAVAESPPGTVVVGVDQRSDSVAVAAVAGERGAAVSLLDRVDLGLPMRVRHVGATSADVYADPRVERVVGWERAIAALNLPASGPLYLSGASAKESARLGGVGVGAAAGAASSLGALAEMIDSAQEGQLVALSGGSAAAVLVEQPGEARLHRDVREPIPAAERPVVEDGANIPYSMPAFARAAEARLGLIAARCECGEVSFPARVHCLACGRQRATAPEPLARTGEVYTQVTVHTPVPGLPVPNGLAIVAIDDSDVRVLARVTDMRGAACSIGDRGRMVLRRTADREGVPDYAYAFQPAEPELEAS